VHHHEQQELARVCHAFSDGRVEAAREGGAENSVQARRRILLDTLQQNRDGLFDALTGPGVHSDFPFLTEFYRLNPKGKFQLAFKPSAPFKFYGGGNGPQSLRLCGRIMDGFIVRAR
jgi:hypothetical protein